MKNIKRTYKLILQAWKPLLLFELIYKIFASFVLLPFLTYIFDFAVSNSSVKYVSIYNIKEILTSPLLVVTLLCMGAIVTIYTFLEIAGIIICLNQVYNNEELRIDSFLKHTLFQVFWIFKPKNIILLFTGMVLLPLSTTTFSSSVIGNFRIPIFIGAELHPPLSYIYWAAQVFISLFVFLFILVFHCFFLDRKNAITSFKEAFRLNSKHIIRTFTGMLVVDFFTMIILFMISASLIAGLMYICFISNIVTTALGFYSVYKASFSCLTFIFKTFCIIASYSYLTLKFYDYKEEKGEWSPRFYDENEVVSKKVNTVVLIPLVCISVFMVSCSNFETYRNSSLSATEKDRMLVIAHRGDAMHAPENTIPAIEKAIEKQADYAEIDVQMTKDNVVVLTHDTNLKRVTGKDIDVSKITYAQLQELDASMGDPDYAGTTMPSLDKVMRVADGRIRLLIELKPVNGNDEALVKAVVKAIRTHGFEDQCAIHSLSYETLELVKKRAPDILCGYCTPFIQGDYYNLEAADFFTVEQTYVTASQIEIARKKGKDIWLWTVDDADDMDNCIKIRAGGIITNDPESAVSFRSVNTDLDQLFYEFCWSIDAANNKEVDTSE